MLIITGLLILLCAAAIYFYGYSTYSAIDLFTHPEPIDPDFHPPVSILKPLCGLDRNAYQNLSSFCQQDYPDYQIVFSVREANDPILDVVNTLTHEFASLDIHCVICDRTIGANPKVSNLANAVTAAKYPILVIADSDIQVGSDYLRQIIQPLKHPHVAVVTCLYRSVAEGWVSILEAVGVAIESHAQVLVERKMFGMSAAIGSTIVIRRAVLDAFGGFAAISDRLMDDFHLGYQSTQLGYTVVLSDYVVDHVMAHSTLKDFFQHQLRWAVSIRASRLWGYLGIILTHGTTMSLLLLWVTGGSRLGWIVLLATWGSRLIMAWIVGVHYLKEPAVKRFFWLVPCRDLISSVLWCCGLVGNTISWRGHRLKLVEGGKLVAIDE